MKKKITIFIICFAIVINVSIIFITYKINVNDISYEKFNLENEVITDQQFYNANMKYIEDMYFEYDNYAGFSDDDIQFNIKEIYGYLSLLDLLGMNDEINTFSSNYNNLILKDSIQFNSLIDFMYYNKVLDILNISTSTIDIESVLDCYYDSNDNLFFNIYSGESLNSKLIVSSIVNSEFKDDSVFNKYNLLNGIETAYNNFIFYDDSYGYTFYNSGGIIMYAMNSFDLMNETIINQHLEWFNSWLNYYSSLDYTEITQVIQYSEFYKIERIFNQESKQLDEYFSTLKYEEISDFYSVYNFIESIKDIKSNIEYIEQLETYLSKEVNNLFYLFSVNIDLEDTYYGVLLAQLIGHQINEEKIKITMLSYYYTILKGVDTFQDTVQLYYLLLLNDIIDANLDKDLIYNKLNLLFNKVQEFDRLETRIYAYRYLLQCYSMSNNQIYKKYIKTIKKDLLNVEEDFFNESYNLMVVCEIKKMIGIDIDQNEVLSLSDQFKSESGYLNIIPSGIENIYSLYEIYVIIYDFSDIDTNECQFINKYINDIVTSEYMFPQAKNDVISLKSNFIGIYMMIKLESE